MAFILAGVLLAAFVLNVSIGAVTADPILGNVAEMLLLLAASTAFVAGVLKREAQEAEKRSSEQQD